MNAAAKINALERRLRFLTDKLADGDYSDGAASWAAAEVTALEWAIPLLRDEIPQGVSERHHRDLLTVARNAARLARAHPEMGIATVAHSAANTGDDGMARRLRPDDVRATR